MKRIVASFLVIFIIVTGGCSVNAEQKVNINISDSENENIIFNDDIEKELIKADTTKSAEISVVKTSMDQSAVITTTGDLYVWGDGSPNNAVSPQLLMSNVKDISFAGSYPHVLKNDGTLWTWKKENEKVTAVKVMSDVIQVVSGFNMTAAIKSNGDLWTWGSNYCGQLGQGIGDVSWDDATYAPKCILNNVQKIIIDSDEHYGRAGAITTRGELYIWGEQVITGEAITIPSKVMDDVTDYVMGYGLNVALKNDGTVWTWGENKYGELGVGTTSQSVEPVKVSLSNVCKIYYSEMSEVVLAITSSGELYVWGGYLSASTWNEEEFRYDYYTENDVLTRRFIDSRYPRLMATDVKDCAGACFTIYFTKNDNTLWGWGYPYSYLGDLGEEDGEYLYPQKITNSVKDITYADPDCYDVRVPVWAIIKTDGSLWMWGNEFWGAIGANTEYGYTSNFHEITIPEISLQGSEVYYSATESRLFRVMDANNTSYPSPAGFTVTVGSNTFKSGNTTAFGSDDITATVPTGYSGNIKVSKSGYYDYILPAKYTGQYNVVTMTPTTVTAPFIQTLLVDNSSVEYNGYRNVLADSVMMYQQDLESTGEKNVEIYPSVEWCGHGAGTIWLEQGDIKVTLKNNMINMINWNAYYFSANQPIYLCAKASDGSYIKVKTKINVYQKYDSGVTLDLGERIEIDMDESGQEELDLFAGQKIKFDFSEISDGKLPFSFSVKDDGTIEGVIGMKVYENKESYGSYGDKANNTSNVYHQVKDVLTKLKSIKGNDKEIIKAKEIAKLEKDLRSKGAISSVNGSVGVDGNVSVLGYFTGKLENGKVSFKECQIALNAEGSVSYTHNTMIMTVPVYLKAKLAAEVEWLIKMSYGNESFTLPEEDGEYVDVTLKGSFEGGPGWYGYLSVGGQCGADIKISNKLPIRSNNTVCSASADVSVTGTLMGFDGEWVIKKFGERIFWDGGWCWKEPGAVTTSEMYFVPDMTVNEMQMMEETTEINGESVVKVEGDNAFVSGISGYSAPTAIQMNDKMIVVWVADVEGRSAADSKALYYSICENETWTIPVLVCDDGTRDSTPELYEVDGTVYLAWENSTQVYNTDEVPASVLGNSVSGNTVDPNQMATVVSVYDQETNTWGTPSEENPEWYLAEVQIPEDYDGELPSTYSTRKVIATEDRNMILYTASDDKDIVQIYGIFKDENGWGKAIPLTDTESNILGFDAVYSDNELKLLCATGEYSDAALSCVTYDVSNHQDVGIEYLTYAADTLVPGRDMIVNVFVKNNSPYPIDGFEITVNGGENSYTETSYEQLMSGAEEIYDIKFPLPDNLDFRNVAVTVSPLSGKDVNVVDNTEECVLHMSDVSLEYTAANLIQDKTKVVAQVINRGHEETEQETRLIIRKNASDGEVVCTVTIPALAVGEVYHVEEELTGLVAGDMLYAEVTELETENIYANNSTEMVVVEMNTKKVDYVVVSETESGDIPVDSYTIAATAGANGTITPAGNNSVLKGGEISFVITPAAGYKIESVLVDQVSVGAVGTYKFTDVQASHTIFASFVKEGTTQTPTPTPTPTPPAQTECKHNYVYYRAAYFESGGFDWKQEKCSKCSHIKTTYYRIAGVSVGETFKVGSLQYKVTSNATYKPQVKLVKVTNKNIKTLKVPGKVKYKGNEFEVIQMADGLCKNFKKLNKVVIGNWVKSIPKNAFYKCKKLKTVEIGDEVTSIGDQAFYGCTALKKVDTGFYLTSIGKKAFYGCTALTNISLSDIKKIGDAAFMNCKKLDYVNLYSIKTIGSKAFYNCKKLYYIIIGSKNLKSVGSKAFINISKDADIELLESKYNKYKNLLKGKCPKGVNFLKY